MSLLTN